jgi:hypothetical protein
MLEYPIICHNSLFISNYPPKLKISTPDSGSSSNVRAVPPPPSSDRTKSAAAAVPGCVKASIQPTAAQFFGIPEPPPPVSSSSPSSLNSQLPRVPSCHPAFFSSHAHGAAHLPARLLIPYPFPHPDPAARRTSFPPCRATSRCGWRRSSMAPAAVAVAASRYGRAGFAAAARQSFGRSGGCAEEGGGDWTPVEAPW